MILADTSIWIDHLTAAGHRLAELLASDQVVVHPLVIGELAMGNLGRRQEVLSWLRSMPTAKQATFGETLALVEAHTLSGRGIGFVDACLLASALLTPHTQLWTRDRRLAAAAQELGVGA